MSPIELLTNMVNGTLSGVITAVYPLSPSALRGLAGEMSAAIEAATLALVRLDERLAQGVPVLAEGVRARAHALEAQALVQLAGESVGIEELALHEAGMDTRMPTTGTVRAARILAERRSIARRKPEAVLEATAVRRLLGLPDAEEAGASDGGQGGAEPEARSVAGPQRALRPWDFPRLAGTDDGDDALWPDEAEAETEEELDAGDEREADADLAAVDRLLARTRRTLAVAAGEGGAPSVRLRDPAYGAEDRLAAWLAALDDARRLPGVLGAAVALDAWLLLEPAERGGANAGADGWALAATLLGARGLALHHLPALGLGYRRGRFRWSPHAAPARRIAGLVAAVEGSAALAAADLQRLTLAREAMLRRCEGRRGNSQLPRLVDLFTGSPLVTVALAAERLQVSPQAVEAMLMALGPSLPRELTGRKRYRAWGIV